MNNNVCTILNREYSFFTSLAEELNFQAGKNYLFDLDYLNVVDVQGEKGLEFLQGQLTCNVLQVTANTMRSGAQCNLKGRILALMDILSWQGLKLILPTDLTEESLSILSKPAILSKVSFNKLDTYKIFGFFGPNVQDLTPYNQSLPSEPYQVEPNKTHCIYAINTHLYILIIPATQTTELLEPFIKRQQFRGSISWHYLELTNMRMQIYPQSRGLFLPHHLNLHTSSYISFDKGCYKGQEIIARMHYKAKKKYELQKIHLNHPEKLTIGQKLYAPHTAREIGEIIDFCPLENGQYLALVSLLLEFIDKEVSLFA